MKIPTKVPEPGFYYHYKHDPKGPVNVYSYEMIGVGCHTEDNCSPADSNMVAYRPLYDSSIYSEGKGKLFYLRPLEMWIENVTKGDKTFPRFQKITDSAVIAELQKIKLEMYGPGR